MKIQNMFQKDIERDINGVIKVMQDDDRSLEQELSEYIITKELRRHFRTFFDNYTKAIDQPTDKIGVWISGFFGSGKSHFLKILSYLLSNQEVCGKRAIDYFADKFDDPMMYAQAVKSVSVPTQSILFNIDIEGPLTKDKTAVLRVFAKMFYNHCGFYGDDLKIAKLERFIEKQGKTQQFREAFEKVNGAPWTETRDSFAFFEDDIVSVLQSTLGMSEQAARNWFNGEETNELSIAQLVADIQEYVDGKGKDFRLLFMVDEVGQYIGDDGDLMINLQSLVEEIGIRCHGKVWVMVTSQEAIDSVVHITGNDFSKIQGRFNTRLSLSSSSVDEVIKKRVLAKTDAADQLLRMVYDKEHAVLKNLYARIIRNLCIIRTAIERNYRKINDIMRMEYRGLLSMPEILPMSSMQQLSNDGISFIKKSSTKLCHHIIEINRLISDRINNCKSLFPIWINWAYIKELFIMPNGLTEDGTKDAADTYYASLSYYPYQMYINWVPMDEGNVLYNDKKFATLLYQWHCDAFTEYSKVSDAGAFVKNNIYDFIDDSEKTVLVVDCENSDPYKLCATLKNLDYEVMQKITAIILFDDVHTATAWRILENYTRIPVEHIMIERIKQNKSLVDIKLTARACQEHYQKQVDSFVIVSSDSDYWGLISSLPDARFLVMIEREKCGPDMKAALAESGIFYCYLDDFYSGNSEDIKKNALFKEMYRWIDNSVHLNVNDMFDAALRNTRIEMSPAERRQFYEKHIRHMTLTIDENGNVSIELKRG